MLYFGSEELSAFKKRLRVVVEGEEERGGTSRAGNPLVSVGAGASDQKKQNANRSRGSQKSARIACCQSAGNRGR